ncbi:hypothetical protein GOBAR_DD32927 [Gossypium barbadense]|nr:hypothetical protein GOBAR_DD32927 [Gossypium barbadense]
MNGTAALSNTVGTLVVDCVVKPVGRQLDYVRRFHDNVEKLREKKRELADARKRLLLKIEEAKNRLLLIEDDVQNLQSRADETLSDMGTLEEEIQLNKRCLNWCPNWSWRYQLSKKAMKKIQDISELLDKFGQLGPVGYPAPTALPTIDFLCSKEFVFSKSSETAFYQIIEALKDENINMIGLWGMGGVGKTTLAREVGSQAQKLNLFDKVVITTEKIGIPIGDDHKGCKVLLTTRRQQVCRAMDCQNVVQLDCLDDDEAWTLFEKKAGLDDFSDDSIKILANQIVKKCKGLPIAIVPLGSALKGKTHHEWQAAYRRLKDRRLTEIEDVNEENAYVCLEASFDYLKTMETKTCFLLCSLFPEDDEIYVENLVGYAWGLELYKGMDSIKDVSSEVLASIETLKNSGLLLDCGERHVKMHDVVRQFALWIASSRKEISFGTVETLPMDESSKHYRAISFETGQTDELPKGVVFPYLKLLLLGGNRLMETSSEFFEGMKALQVCALKDQLISLAAFKFHMNLRTLCLIDCQLSDISMLGKLKSLHILSLSGSDIIELPTEAGDLENLRLLVLSYCYKLRSIPPNLIRRLPNLEELYLHGCSSLKWATDNSTKRESYSSLSELNSLPKLVVISLDISSEHLPDGFVFRRLWSFDFCIGIERKMWYQKRDMWFQKRETYPISRSLRIDNSVDACKQLFEDVESLQLNHVEGHRNLVPSLDLGFSKLTSLDLRCCDSMQCLIDASKQQVPITTLSNLRKLSLNDLSFLEELCNGPQPQGFLQKLEEFKVESCHSMKVLFPIAELRSIEQEGPGRHLSLQSLKIVEIEGCNNLKYIFPMSVANSLGQLHTLKIKSCLQLEDIIQDPQVAYVCLLQSLREVSLIDLPQLKGRDVNDIMLTQSSLQKLKVHNCPQLTHFFISTTIQKLELSEMTEKKQISNVTVPERRGETSTCTEYLTISNFEELFEYSGYNLSTLYFLRLYKLTELRVIWSGPIQVEHFQNLAQLTVQDCRRLRYIFSPTIARNLPQLWTLVISNCEELEQMIEKDQTSSQHHLQPICFPNLSYISIRNCENLKCLFPITLAHGGLPNLLRLCLEWVSKLEQVFEGDESNLNKEEEKVIRLPQLCSLELIELPNLVSFSPVGYHFIFPSLTDLRVKGCPNITTRFSVDSEKSVHAKTQASQSVDEIIVEDSVTAQETAWPIGSDIYRRTIEDSDF